MCPGGENQRKLAAGDTPPRTTIASRTGGYDHRVTAPQGDYTASILRTHISEVFWYDPEAENDPPFTPADIPKAGSDGGAANLAWLDCLLHGGIHLPDS